MLFVVVESVCFIVYGLWVSYIKYGFDLQEEWLKNGEWLLQEDWGYDMCDGILICVEGDECSQEKWLMLLGNYFVYYVVICDVFNGVGENLVLVSEVIQIMILIELGIELVRYCVMFSLV